MMFDRLPSKGLLILFGVPGSGKSTIARLAFAPECVLSTDSMRALVGGSADNLAVTSEAHTLLSDVAAHRLSAGLLTVLDSTGTDADLTDRLERAAAAAGAEVAYLEVDTSLEESVRRNSLRVRGRVPDAAMQRITREVEGLSERLRRSGARLITASSLADPRLRGHRAFLAMPVTEYIAGAGFRADKRELYECIHAAFDLAGMRVSSAALNERYGSVQLPASEYASYDVRQILESDCLLVCTTSALSPDTYLEIGVAVGAGKPVGVVIPEKSHRSGMLRGLAALGKVVVSAFATDADLPRALLEMAAQVL
jgi:predicted kinase/nucleoside 2-deoxyribosyltransferase